MNKYAVLAFAFSLVFAACFGSNRSRDVSPHATRLLSLLYMRGLINKNPKNKNQEPMKSKVRKEYEAALAKAEVTPFEGKDDVIDLYTDVVCGAVLVAEENAKQIGGPTWQNAGLCRTMLKYGRELEKVTGYGNVTDTLYWAAERMEESLYGHPRLRSELINFIIHLLHIIECDTGHDLSSTDHFMEKLARVDRNIQYADSGKLDLIEQEGHMKNDPVEWTARFEEVIDDAEREALSHLTDAPRSMGFCHAYWSRLSDALSDRGIDWRSPALMNPRCMFD